jgi:hypothetical protein
VEIRKGHTASDHVVTQSLVLRTGGLREYLVNDEGYIEYYRCWLVVEEYTLMFAQLLCSLPQLRLLYVYLPQGPLERTPFYDFIVPWLGLCHYAANIPVPRSEKTGEKAWRSKLPRACRTCAYLAALEGQDALVNDVLIVLLRKTVFTFPFEALDVIQPPFSSVAALCRKSAFKPPS